MTSKGAYLWAVVELRAVYLSEEFMINESTQSAKNVERS